MSNFLQQVEDAVVQYGCAIGPTGWLNVAAANAALGSGVGAAAAIAASAIAAMGCNKPNLDLQDPDGGPEEVFEIYDTGAGTVSRSWRIPWTIQWRGAKGGSPIFDCQPQTYGPNSGEYQISATRVRLGVRSSPLTSICSGLRTYSLVQRLNNNTTWTYNTSAPSAQAYSCQIAASAYVVGTPPIPPTTPPPPSGNFNITVNFGGPDITVPITVDPPQFIFAPSGDISLNFPITIAPGPISVGPIKFDFELNISTGGTGTPGFDPNGPGYGNKPAGGGPKLPINDRPKVDPEPPFNFNGSWAQKICNIDGSEIITAVPYTGTNFAGVQAAFTALSTVLGMWQEETIDCDPDSGEPLLYSIPIDQWRETIPYRPRVGLWFWESRQSAINAGRVTRCRRVITVPLDSEAIDPEIFIEGEVNFWENYTWEAGPVLCTYRTRELSQTLRLNAISQSEGTRVLTDILNRYGYPVDFSTAGRFTTGAVPNMGQSIGGGYIETTVQFYQASYSSEGANYAAKSPASVARAGLSKRGTGNDPQL